MSCLFSPCIRYRMKSRGMVQWICLEAANDARLDSGDFEKANMAFWYFIVTVRLGVTRSAILRATPRSSVK